MNSHCAKLLQIIIIVMTTTTPKMIMGNKATIMITSLTGVIEMWLKIIKIELKAVKHIIGRQEHFLMATRVHLFNVLATARAIAAIFKSLRVIFSVSDSEDSDKLKSVAFCSPIEVMIEEMF